MGLDELLARVHAAPRGSTIAAVVDLDGTLLTGSATASTGFAQYQGRSPDELRKLGQAEFDTKGAGRLHKEVWELIEAHHQMGHTVVLACAAAGFQAQPPADAIRAAHLLCTELEVVDGAITGRRFSATLTGPVRATAVWELAAQEGIDLARSFAYGSDAGALPVLEAVGHPVAVSADSALGAAVDRRGWPVLHCLERGGTPTLIDRVRTVGFYGGFAAGAGAGAAAGAWHRSKRAMVDVSFARGADFGLAAAGVRVRVVEGAQHLNSGRPGIFVFNHQSMVDPVIVMKLVRGKLTGVAKREARDMPGFGRLFEFAGVAFVHRGNTAQAKQALAPAVAKVREESLSLLLAPEGTRSATPRVGEFKKAAFHIAMQAEAPMVPIVIRNAGEVWWKGSQVIRPGTVDVVVLPPVDTSTWQPATLADHVTEVRNMFVDTLACWPGRSRGSA